MKLVHLNAAYYYNQVVVFKLKNNSIVANFT